MDTTHSIMPMTGNDGECSCFPKKDNLEAQFAVTQGFMGRTVAILVSDVISCQLGKSPQLRKNKLLQVEQI